MSNQTIEKEVCVQCGVDVREGTQFCYNCGCERPSGTEIAERDTETDFIANPTDESVSAESNGNIPEAEKKAALDDLAAKFHVDEPNTDEKLALAAEQRREARVGKRTPKQFRWEPADDLAPTRILAFAILIAVTAGIVVLVTVYWR